MTHNPSIQNHPDNFYVTFWLVAIGNRRSVERGQPKELRLEVLHAPEPQRGLKGEAPVEVVVRHHHHLHAGRQRCLHAVGSVFKHQALAGGWKQEVRCYQGLLAYLTRGEKYRLTWQHNDSGGAGYRYSQAKIMYAHIRKGKLA